MDWLDWIVLVLVALAAIRGLRLGAIQQILSFGGFWLGLFIGLLLAPHFAAMVSSPTSKELVVIVTVIGAATIVGALGRTLGSVFSSTFQRIHLGGLDSVLGVVAAVLATLFAVWIIGGFLVNSRWTGLDSGIGGSRITRALYDVLGPPPVAKIESLLSKEGFPVAFAGIPPVPSGPVALPSNAQERAAVLAADRSTLEIQGTACGLVLEGTGFVVAPGYVATNAHVVAGERQPFVIENGARVPATPVFYDPRLDLAVLSVPTFGHPSLRLDAKFVPNGTGAVVMGYPGGGPFTYGDAGVMATYDAKGLDIYGNAYVTREIYGLKAIVRPGNSGGPLVEPDGTVIGVVFARSTTDPNVGYAIASPAVRSEVNSAVGSTAPVSTQSCTSG